MNVRVFNDLESLSHAAARTIIQRVSGLDSAVIGVSGGSTPRRLYQLLGAELTGLAVTWVLVDERYVPLTHPRSNAAMLEGMLFAGGMHPTHRFLRFRTEGGDPAESARTFEAEWRSYGITTLDAIILGCGDDGHTASIFPETKVPDVGIAQPVFVTRLDEWRVTLTMPVIRAAALRIVMASGPEKAPIVREVRDGVRYPIAEAMEGEGEAWWFVDRAAYGSDAA